MSAVDLLTPATVRKFEAAVSDPMFFPWLVTHASEWAGRIPDGHPWQSWLLRVQAVANDLPPLMRTPVEETQQ